jgi:hypothetical protein
MTGMEQAALVCLMVFNVLPVLALPSAWREPRGWPRRKAVAACICMYLVTLAMATGYALLIGVAA